MISQQTRFGLFLIALSLFCTAGSLLADKKPKPAKMVHWKIDTYHTSAKFRVKHLGISEVEGSINVMDGEVIADESNPSTASVRATLDIASINTGNEKRDTHLKSEEFFNAKEFPKMEFKSKKVVKNKKGQWLVTGDLTIKDKTKEVVLTLSNISKPVKNLMGKMSRGLKAQTSINRFDFDLKWNKIVEGVNVVDKTVNIEIPMELIMEEEPAT